MAGDTTASSPLDIGDEEFQDLRRGTWNWIVMDLVLMGIGITPALVAAYLAPDPWDLSWQSSRSGVLEFIVMLMVQFIGYFVFVRFYWRAWTKATFLNSLNKMHSIDNDANAAALRDTYIDSFSRIGSALLAITHRKGRTPAADYYARRLAIEIHTFFSFIPELFHKAWVEHKAEIMPAGSHTRLFLTEQQFELWIGLSEKQVTRWAMDIGLHMAKYRKPLKKSEFEYWTLLYIIAGTNKQLGVYGPEAYDSYRRSIEEFLQRKEIIKSSRWASFYDVIKKIAVPLALTVLTSLITSYLKLS